MSSATHPLPETLYPLNPLETEVLAQTRQFEAALPGLMVEHAGRWVVWLDGLRGFHESHDAAWGWALDNLAEERGFVVAQVAPRAPVYLSGVAAFGL